MSASRGEISQTQALIRAATTLEQIRVICDRTHEENIIAARDGRDLEVACHYAFAVGTVMQVAIDALERLEAIGIRRAELHEEANARALASLEAFRKSLSNAGLAR